MDRELSKKISKINVIATISILILHSYDVPSYSGSNSFFELISFIEKWISVSFLGHTSVNVFFIISGFLFAYSIKSLKDWKNKLLKRFSTLFLPYLFWATFGFLVLFACSLIPAISRTMNMKVELSIVLLKDVFVNLNYNHPLWYIQNLVLYFFISSLLYFISKNKIVSIVFELSLIVLVIVGVEIPIFMLMRFTVYSIGFMIGRFMPSCINFKNKRIAWICLTILAITSLFISKYNIKTIDNSCYLLFPLLAWYAIDLIPTNDRVISFFNDKTFWIYCGHGVILECFKQLFSIIVKFFNNKELINVVAMILSYILSPILTLTILSIAFIVVNKLSPQFINIVTGGRSKKAMR